MKRFITNFLMSILTVISLINCGGANGSDATLNNNLQSISEGSGNALSNNADSEINKQIKRSLEVAFQRVGVDMFGQLDQIDPNKTNFSISNIAIQHNGAHLGNYTANISLYGQTDDVNGTVNFNESVSYHNYADSADYIIDGTSEFSIIMTGTQDMINISYNASGTYAVSGVFGGKMSFNINATGADTADNIGDNLNRLSGNVVVVSHGQKYECEVSIENNDYGLDDYQVNCMPSNI